MSAKPEAITTDPAGEPAAIAAAWLEAFDQAMTAGDAAAAANLFLAQGWWRDLLALTGDLRTREGRDRIGAGLAPALARQHPRGFCLQADRPVTLEQPDADTAWVQGFCEFETDTGRGRGFLRLMRDADGVWRAWTLGTALESLKGHEEALGHRRPQGVVHGPQRDRENWAERRAAAREFADRDPRVLVIGAGQGGLTIAARLGRLGVDTLVVEKNPRVGDNWRNRYHSLVLHDPVWYDHMPYLPFPPHWPVFTPKDKLADWFEHYANALELNIWTGSRIESAEYDKTRERWAVQVRRCDGSLREMHPNHLVMATGISGLPLVPDIPGMDDFRGQVVHSSAHQGGEGWAGRKAVVVGTGNSGHDIAHEFHEHGADTTMVQRSSTYVISSENGIPTLFGGLYEEGGPPTEDADLMFASLPYPLLAELHKGLTQQVAEMDRELLDGLESAGFKLDFGEDGSGLFMKYLRRGGGYYIDVGCSRLIAEGAISVKQGAGIEAFTETGLRLDDGSHLEADIVVLATGYTNMRERARALLGDDVADRARPVWGLDDEGELRTIWRESGHPGLWFMGGNLHQSRHYSKFLALQIKAREEGIALG
ncbi:MAG: NAD(P)/FAD-dependent oxidoreductase [Salinisphaeraceae bacterium]